jgi:glycosyltransferase involved in cell wall biosynthesis
MTKTIWFDVTTLHNWFRPAVGIIRMELECARYLLLEFEGCARFCRYERGRGVYYEVHRDETRSIIERLDRSIYGRKDDFGSRVRVLENEIKKFIQKRIEHLSPPNQEKAKYILRSVRNRAYILISKLSGIWFYRRHCREVQFLSGDVYITLGADWWLEYKDLRKLYTIKEKTGIKVLGICYDIIPIKFPHLCIEQVAQIFSRYIVDLSWCADRILCISENTRHDLSQFVKSVNGRLPRLEVIQLGSEIKAKTGTVNETIQNICKRPFILYVSTIERRKNHEVLYRAYTRLVERGRRDLPRLVFVGMPGWGVSDIFAALRFDPRIKGLIVQLNQVNDAELDLLYRHALFSVFPSLYEGWGLPVAESLAYGKFCIVSNTSSLPEVGSDLVEYLDPWDLPVWVERLAYYFDNPMEIKKREEKISSGYIPTTWADTARVLISHARDL